MGPLEVSFTRREINEMGKQQIQSVTRNITISNNLFNLYSKIAFLPQSKIKNPKLFSCLSIQNSKSKIYNYFFAAVVFTIELSKLMRLCDSARRGSTFAGGRVLLSRSNLSQ